MIRNQYGIGADGVLDYFEDNYVERFRVNAPRGIQTFPIDHRTNGELPRTNNTVEGWQIVLEVLQKEETVVRV